MSNTGKLNRITMIQSMSDMGITPNMLAKIGIYSINKCNPIEDIMAKHKNGFFHGGITISD